MGHLYGSDLPVGGEGTHSVLTAHTGLVNASLFDTLTDVEMDDPIYVSVSGEKMKYQVNDIRVVLPHETDSLRPEADKGQVTLITCTPYGVNSHRLLVTGQRVPYDEEAADVFKSRG
ncbi:sortase [Corynebacterium diphtheriae]|uniref:sortase n=1 Tax=Corynebacterium diphtheriae TaxID=1717 RepID=UPI000E153D0D|nr:sortase [Corynebacterium diphtheriae]UEB38770.1 sortase [Corynebacterium diphtheriae]WLF42976.1 sortase [Corynebacterium diphtheriae]CAB0584755.1 class C sortase [Corynebacterium diphtheriae]SUY73046.1 putative fimbrial associated sortase-like protein [Corynebacterium diphtheriae bv. mitis]